MPKVNFRKLRFTITLQTGETGKPGAFVELEVKVPGGKPPISLALFSAIQALRDALKALPGAEVVKDSIEGG